MFIIRVFPIIAPPQKIIAPQKSSYSIQLLSSFIFTIVGYKFSFCSSIECWNFPIAVIISWNWSRFFRETFFLNRNSARLESIISLLVPCIFLFFDFASLHIDSTLFVCAPVVGPTKFSEWFTV